MRPAPDGDAALCACHNAVERLLADTGASRVTLRLEDAEGGFPVVAEACAEGVRSLRGESGIDLRAAPTCTALERDRTILVQEDLERAVPPALVRAGARAQMLGPLVDGDRLAGVVSVHESKGSRRWSRQDVALLVATTSTVAGALGADATRRP